VATPKWVKAIGWSCVGFGAFLLWSAGMSLALWYLVPQAFDPAAPSVGPELPAMGWIRAHWRTYGLAQAALGVAHLVIGLGILRLRAWARAALEAMCWLLLVGTIASTWGLGPGFPGAPGGSADTPGVFVTVLAVLLGAAQVAGLAALILFLRRKETRGVFAAATPGGGEARGAKEP
jgi:hypothetical protein